MPISLKTLILVFGLPLFLMACETPLQEQNFSDLTFTHLTPIKLNVSKIDVVVQYNPPLRAPNVEHLFPTLPVAAIKQWAKDRLRAAGASGEAKLIIIKAGAVEKQLLRKEGFAAALTRQQTQRYDATLEVRLEIIGYLEQGATLAHVTRFTTVSEDATINERERAWFELTEALARDFDSVIEENIRQHLSQWLR
jgi:hypothetical protein